ncbi:MAG: hypothetical protein ACREUU_00655 [Gammaproteobacteria bacterium]
MDWIMWKNYDYRDRRIHGADLIAIWAVVGAILVCAGLWSVL